DSRECRGMATFAKRVPAPPGPHLRPGSNAQSRKSGSVSPPFLPTHGEKDVRPIEIRLRAAAYRIIGDRANMSDTRRRNAQLSAMDLTKYDRCFPLTRYSGGIYECFPDGCEARDRPARAVAF